MYRMMCFRQRCHGHPLESPCRGRTHLAHRNRHGSVENRWPVENKEEVERLDLPDQTLSLMAALVLMLMLTLASMATLMLLQILRSI
jgi:hypothetical protein